MQDTGEGAGDGGRTDRSPARAAAARLSLSLSVASALLMVVIASVRWLRDGSFWLDEASIAFNLLEQTPRELLGPFLTGHSFPRLYLALINALKGLLGYHTLVLRALPYCAFVAGAIAWQRLVHLRFRRQPALLGLLIVLNLIPATWFAYSAMLKQYSLDVAVALVPFLVSDRFFDRALGRGRDRGRLLALASPCLVSFTYVIALLGRTLGWYLSRLRRDGARLQPAGVAVLGTGLALSLAGLWWIDLRHTAGSAGLIGFWAKCIPRADWSRTPELLMNFLTGWYRGTLPFGAHAGLPEEGIALLALAMAIGCLEIGRRALANPAKTTPGETDWGSRSAGCLVCVGGVIAASLVVDYPLCPGRLTLFSLFSLQIVTLEGVHALGTFARSRRVTRVGFGALVVLCTVAALPTAHRSVHHLIVRDTPENVRPLLHFLEEAPDLPILVADCSSRQIWTLPEWRGRESILYYDYESETGSGFPDAPEFWVISAGSNFYCPWFIRKLHRRAEHVQSYGNMKNTAALLRVRMPESGDP